MDLSQKLRLPSSGPEASKPSSSTSSTCRTLASRTLTSWTLISFLLATLTRFGQSEFIPRGSNTTFICESQKDKDGRIFEPILKRNDDHHKLDPVNLFVGSAPRPIVDSDWSFAISKNATTGIDKFYYYLDNIDFEDAGIYVCDDVVEKKRNFTVVDDKVVCKEGAIRTKQGSKIETSCTLGVDGPDPVELGWFLDGEEQKSQLKEILPADQSITSMIEIVAQPDHHNQKLQCRSNSKWEKGAVKYTCDVSLDVEYPVQIKGQTKSVIHNKQVEAEVRVIGNPWPGKGMLKVVGDDIDKIEIDELDSGLGAEVTVHIPTSAFKKKAKSTVIIKSIVNDELIGSIDVQLPKTTGTTAYIAIIVVLAVVALLLVIGIVVCLKRKKNNKDEATKDVPLAEQAA